MVDNHGNKTCHQHVISRHGKKGNKPKEYNMVKGGGVKMNSRFQTKGNKKITIESNKHRGRITIWPSAKGENMGTMGYNLAC